MRKHDFASCIYEQYHKKTWIRGFQPCQTQTKLYSPRMLARGLKVPILEIDEFRYAAKTMALISCMVTVQLLFAPLFFAYA